MSQLADLESQSVKGGSIIFNEGDKDLHFYILQEGKVEIHTKNTQGNKVSIAVIEEGDAFGEFSLLEQKPRSASATALTDCTFVKISESAYEKLLMDLPDWANAMLKSLASRLKSMNEKLKQL